MSTLGFLALVAGIALMAVGIAMFVNYVVIPLIEVLDRLADQLERNE